MVLDVVWSGKALTVKIGGSRTKTTTLKSGRRGEGILGCTATCSSMSERDGKDQSGWRGLLPTSSFRPLCDIIFLLPRVVLLLPLFSVFVSEYRYVFLLLRARILGLFQKLT